MTTIHEVPDSLIKRLALIAEAIHVDALPPTFSDRQRESFIVRFERNKIPHTIDGILRLLIDIYEQGWTIGTIMNGTLSFMRRGDYVLCDVDINLFDINQFHNEVMNKRGRGGPAQP
jgi:hypothetical protein